MFKAYMCLKLFIKIIHLIQKYILHILSHWNVSYITTHEVILHHFVYLQYRVTILASLNQLKGYTYKHKANLI